MSADTINSLIGLPPAAVGGGIDSTCGDSSLSSAPSSSSSTLLYGLSNSCDLNASCPEQLLEDEGGGDWTSESVGESTLNTSCDPNGLDLSLDPLLPHPTTSSPPNTVSSPKFSSPPSTTSRPTALRSFPGVSFYGASPPSSHNLFGSFSLPLLQQLLLSMYSLLDIINLSQTSKFNFQQIQFECHYYLLFQTLFYLPHSLLFPSSSSTSSLPYTSLLSSPLPPSLLGHILTQACQEGITDLIPLLLSHPNLDPAVSDNRPLRLACEYGYTDIVQSLLKLPTVDPSAIHNYALRKSSENGHQGVVELLLGDPRVDPSALESDSICKASQSGHTAVVKLLIASNKVDPTVSDNYAITKSAENGHIDVAKVLLDHNQVRKLLISNNQALYKACENGHVEVVQLFFEKLDLSPLQKNLILVSACKTAQYEVVKYLSLLPGIDLSFQNNTPLLEACQSGNSHLILYLLAFPSVNPSAQNNTPLLTACQKGHYEVVLYLLTKAHIDPTIQDNLPLSHACTFGHEHIIRLLLSCPRVNPAASNNLPICVASKNGHVNVVKILLQTKKVNPAARSNEPLSLACLGGHLEVVRILMAHKRVYTGKMYRAASLARDPETLEILLRKGRSLSKDEWMEISSKFLHHGRNDLVQVLDQNKQNCSIS